MAHIKKFIAPSDLELINQSDQEWLDNVFNRFDGFPSLEQIWQLMDEVWYKLKCDSEVIDIRIDEYYSHPVWLLNGLFTEQHEQSLANREGFTSWVIDQNPQRVADIGGGFGTLARMISNRCGNVEVDIIEPYPHQVSIERAKNNHNVRYRKSLEGKYDILIATDIFEHVEDPLALVAQTGISLRQGGSYLIANRFQPVIQCHLPQCFHFRYTWDRALEKMGFRIKQKILYGTIFIFEKNLDLHAARNIELKSKKLWKITENLHRYIQRPLSKILI